MSTEWLQRNAELFDAIEPLNQFIQSIEPPVRVTRIRLSPLCYRKLMKLLEKREAIAEELFGLPALPPGVPILPSLHGIPIYEAVARPMMFVDGPTPVSL